MDESTLARITTFVLHKVAVAGRRVIAERLAQRPGITLWQFAALAELVDHGPTAQHALAAALGIDPSDMVRLMDELIADRLVARSVGDNGASVVFSTSCTTERPVASARRPLAVKVIS